jgi:hypothetical protein
MASCAAMLPARLPAPDDRAGPVHLAPRRAGSGDGSGWADAAPFRQAGRLAARAEPGREFLAGVPAGDMPAEWDAQQILWNAGGTPEAPLRLRFGAVTPEGGFAQPATLADTPLLRMTGSETAPGERPDVGGSPFLVLGARSSHLHVSGPAYDRSGGAGFFNIAAGGTLENLAFADIHARLAGRVIETEEGTALRGVLVERCTALGLIRGFARFRELSEGEFRDLDLDADFIDGGGGAVCQILKVDRGRDLVFRGIRLAKAVNSLAAEERGSSYIQGDGIVLEEETAAVRIADCHAFDMGDGGFDLKSEGVHMTDCTATRCKLGIRIWSHHPDNLIERCTVTEPVWRPENDGACLWVAGRLTAQDCTLHAAGEMSPIRFGAGPDGTPEGRLRIAGGEITHAEGVGLAVGSPGEIELENVRVNGTETSGRFRWTGWRLRRLR